MHSEPLTSASQTTQRNPITKSYDNKVISIPIGTQEMAHLNKGHFPTP